MRALTINVREAQGRMLCCAIFRHGGKKLLAKGHQLDGSDVQMLQSEGLETVWVTELDATEVPEDDAVLQVAAALACGAVEVRPAPGGRANLFAAENACLVVDDELLTQLNCAAQLVTATLPNFSYVKCGDRIATVKSAPFAVPRQQIDAVLAILADRGPVLQARPVQSASAAVIYTDPIDPERARSQFERTVHQRLETYGLSPRFSIGVLEEAARLARAVDQLVRARPSLIWIASTTSPAGPDDSIGRALSSIGCHIERFLAPVEPGNLLLLAYRDEVPIVSAPGCFRSTRPNVLDHVTPPLLAAYRLSGPEIASLGHGGLMG